MLIIGCKKNEKVIEFAITTENGLISRFIAFLSSGRSTVVVASKSTRKAMFSA
jgi:hypothetical protein